MEGETYNSKNRMLHECCTCISVCITFPGSLNFPGVDELNWLFNHVLALSNTSWSTSIYSLACRKHFITNAVNLKGMTTLSAEALSIDRLYKSSSADIVLGITTHIF